MRGEDHPSTLNSLAGLARVYRQSRDYVRAEAIFREVVPRFERVLGPEHPDTLNAKAGLAAVHQNLGDTEPSIGHDLYEEFARELAGIRGENVGRATDGRDD